VARVVPPAGAINHEAVYRGSGGVFGRGGRGGVAGGLKLKEPWLPRGGWSLVIDASLTLTWYFEDEATPATDELLDAVAQNGAVVPPLWPA